MKLSPRQQERLKARQVEVGSRRRVHKRCKLCNMSTNDPDPVNPAKRMRWGYGNKGKVDLVSGEEAMQGKIDHYCDKAVSCSHHVANRISVRFVFG